MIDVRSPVLFTIMNRNPFAYERLLVDDKTPTLAREQLAGVEPAQLFTVPVVSPVAAYAVLAALWLWHDGLEEAHKIVQQTPEALENAALNLHRKPSKLSKNVQSVQSVENPKSLNTQDLRDMAATLAYWHASLQ